MRWGRHSSEFVVQHCLPSDIGTPLCNCNCNRHVICSSPLHQSLNPPTIASRYYGDASVPTPVITRKLLFCRDATNQTVQHMTLLNQSEWNPLVVSFLPQILENLFISGLATAWESKNDQWWWKTAARKEHEIPEFQPKSEACDTPKLLNLAPVAPFLMCRFQNLGSWNHHILECGKDISTQSTVHL